MTLFSGLFTAGAVGQFSPRELATIEVLPFVGIGVVISGLAILAIILTQFWRLGGGDEQGHGHGKKEKRTEGNATEALPSAPALSDDEGELAAIAAAVGLYLEESAETVHLTEVERQFNQTPWTAFGIQSQQYRFQRWQSSR